MAEEKTYFAPLPLRAIGDTRLSALDLRTLACVAAHDRMSGPLGKGQGAWASNRSMAQKAGCDHTSLSSSITRLGKLGYLTREAFHWDKRKHVYRVVYSEGDSFWREKPSDRPAVPQSSDDDFSREQRSPEIVSHLLDETQQSQSDAEGKYIPLSGEGYSVETGKGNSSEDARFAARVARQEVGGENVTARLPRIENALRLANGGTYRENGVQWLNWLSDVIASADDHKISGWAARLSDQLYEVMSDEDRAAWHAEHG